MIKVKSAFYSVAISIFVALGIVGCGGGNNGGGVTAPTPISTPNGDTIVKPNVRVLPTSGTGSIVALTSSTITLSGSSSTLTTGAIVVSGAGEGLLRRVISTSANGSNTVVQTGSATLSDVFQRADIKFDRSFAPISGQSLVNALPGVTLIPSNTAAQSRSSSVSAVAEEGSSFSLGLKDVKVAGIQLNGQVSVGGGHGFECKIDQGQVQMLRFVPHVTAKLDATAQIAGRETQGRQRLGTLVFPPEIILLGPVPVVIVPTLDLFIFGKGSVTAGYQFTVRGGRTLSAGAVYTRNQGWQTVSSFTGVPTASAEKPGFTTSLEASAGIEEQLNFKVYGIAGPYARLNLPSFELKVTGVLSSEPRGADVKIDCVAEASGGFAAPIVDLDLSYPFSAKASIPVFSQFFPIDTPNNLAGTWSAPISLPAFGQCSASSGSITLVFDDTNSDTGGAISGEANYGGYNTGPEGNSFHGTRTGNAFTVTFDANKAKMTGSFQGNNMSISKQAYCGNGSNSTSIQYTTQLTRDANAAAAKAKLSRQAKISNPCDDGSGGCANGYHVYP